MLSVKLARLDEWNVRRADIADVYREGLAGTLVELPAAPVRDAHAWHVFAIRSAPPRRPGRPPGRAPASTRWSTTPCRPTSRAPTAISAWVGETCRSPRPSPARRSACRSGPTCRPRTPSASSRPCGGSMPTADPVATATAAAEHLALFNAEAFHALNLRAGQRVRRIDHVADGRLVGSLVGVVDGRRVPLGPQRALRRARLRARRRDHPQRRGRPWPPRSPGSTRRASSASG